MDKEGLKYNTEREKLIISEYGRNIQIMIKHLLEIEDREKRTEAAHFIVSVMAQMNPQVKESNDYIHKLWDHLYIISEPKHFFLTYFLLSRRKSQPFTLLVSLV